MVCTDLQVCSDGACVCRPELTDCNGVCVDLQSDPDHCGACAAPCMDVCVSGVCADAASCTFDICGGACVDTQTNPLHCGKCNFPCAADQVCFADQCWDYAPAIGCTTCGGCSSCPAPEVCCDLPGYGVSCVDTTAPCP